MSDWEEGVHYMKIGERQVPIKYRYRRHRHPRWWLRVRQFLQWLGFDL